MMNYALFKNMASIIIKDGVRKFSSTLFGQTAREVEYDFGWRNISNTERVVLDIGCSDSSFAYKLAAKKKKDVYAIDRQSYPFKHKNLKFYSSDIRSLPFPDNFFDVITCISVIEHVGKGQYGDSVELKGDLRVMQEMIRCVKKGGKIILTTSWAKNYRDLPRVERYYDDVHLNSLIEGLKLEKKEYYAPQREILSHAFKWVKVKRDSAEDAFLFGSRPIICLLLTKNI